MQGKYDARTVGPAIKDVPESAIAAQPSEQTPEIKKIKRNQISTTAETIKKES